MSKDFNDSEDFLAKWLSGELSAEEQEKFEKSADGEEFMAIVNSVEKIALPAYDTEGELQKLKARRNAEAAPLVAEAKETKVVRFPVMMRYAAAAVIIIGVTLAYFLTRPNYIVYETQFGQTQTITLPDESVVVLNAGSELKYDPDKFTENRKLLLEGEAFFEVTKGINFEVVTDQGTVKVLGTSFNVRNREKLLDVVCYTGKVNVSRKQISKDLNPGDGVRIDNNTLARSWTRRLNEKPSWLLNGITRLEEVTLKDALNELKNIYGIDFESNNSLNSIPYTGVFPNNDEETAIQQVLLPNNIEYTYDSINKKLVLSGIKGQ